MDLLGLSSCFDEVTDFQSIPVGEYTVRVGEVRVGVTRDGSERWGMRLIVSEGDYAGRTAAWDGLVRLGEEISRGWQSPKTSVELLSDMRR